MSVQHVSIIAEAGVNHGGSAGLAHHMIDVAADCGADAVKFQTFVPEALVSASGETAPYQKKTGHSTQIDLLTGLALADGDWAELSAHCTDRGIEFMSTPFDVASAELLVDLGVRRLKIPSGEIDNLPFIARLAEFGLPLIVSTGTADLDEVAAAFEVASAAPEVCLLHCISAYPAPVETANLRALTTMQSRFGCEVGWSDHTAGSLTAVLSVALGATVLEKHFTLDPAMPGPDQAASASPSGFARYVADVRSATRALGHGDKAPHDIERSTALAARRSWHARTDLAVGHVLTVDDLVALRPGGGISPSVSLIGATVTAPIAAGAVIGSEQVSTA